MYGHHSKRTILCEMEPDRYKHSEACSWNILCGSLCCFLFRSEKHNDKMWENQLQAESHQLIQTVKVSTNLYKWTIGNRRCLYRWPTIPQLSLSINLVLIFNGSCILLCHRVYQLRFHLSWDDKAAEMLEVLVTMIPIILTTILEQSTSAQITWRALENACCSMKVVIRHKHKTPRSALPKDMIQCKSRPKYINPNPQQYHLYWKKVKKIIDYSCLVNWE